MNNEIKLAFAHPEARAEATSHDAPADRISVRDHIVEVDIGAFQLERGVTQRVCFNIVVEVRPHIAALSDDVDQILSYDTITDAIDVELGAERLNLLETLAERIAERILVEPQALRCFVRIEKLDRGPGGLGIEIVRAAKPRMQALTEAPKPLVVHLSNPAVHSAHLSQWLDQLERQDAVILTLGAADGPGVPATEEPVSCAPVAPASYAPAAQRRIDLLAIEQNAWVLAGRDRRCVVVSTRTELDWAMRQGHISVWAPSKIVLDAVEHPPADPGDAGALAAWFAQHMGARALWVIGAALPISPLPRRLLDPTVARID